MTTRRPVTVEIVYDGDYCNSACPFLSDDMACLRFSTGLSVHRESSMAHRCLRCKASTDAADKRDALFAQMDEWLKASFDNRCSELRKVLQKAMEDTCEPNAK